MDDKNMAVAKRIEHPWKPELVMTVALGIYSALEIQQMHSVSSDELVTLLQEPRFRTEVKAVRADLLKNNGVFKAKCKVMAELSIDMVYVMAADKDTPAATRVKCVELMVKWAGMEEPAPETPGEKSDKRDLLTLNIVMANPSDKSVAIATHGDLVQPSEVPGHTYEH